MFLAISPQQQAEMFLAGAAAQSQQTGREEPKHAGETQSVQAAAQLPKASGFTTGAGFTTGVGTVSLEFSALPPKPQGTPTAA